MIGWFKKKKNTKISNTIQNQIVVSLLLKMLLTKMKTEIFMLHNLDLELDLAGGIFW